MNISIFLLFLAGIATFTSPCILPLIPAYISYMTGITINSNINKNLRVKLLIHTLFFVMGIGTAFIILQLLISYFANFTVSILSNNLIYNIFGVIVIIFGMQFLGVFKIKFLVSKKRMSMRIKKSNLFSSYILGFVFGFGWTPCVGPVLFSIIAYTSNSDTIFLGIFYMGIYILGLGIPFLIFSLFLDKLKPILDKINFNLVEKIMGLILIIMGLLLFFNKLSLLSSF